MKNRFSLFALVVSFVAFVAICVCGVYALSTLKLNISGSISYDSSDCWVKISGNVEGAANEVAGYEFFEKGLGAAKLWNIGDLDFDRTKSNIITINLSFENYSYYNVKATILGVPQSNESIDISIDSEELYLLEYVDDGIADKESISITFALKEGVEIAQLNIALNIKFEKTEDVGLENYFIYTLSETNATITGLTEQGKSRMALEVPSEIEELPVTDINENAFKDNTNIVRVVLPETLTKIGASAFENCSKLASLSIPTSLSSIGASGFKNCLELTNIELSNFVTEIGESAFYGCAKLKKVVLSNRLKEINNNVFAYCSSLTDINMPTALTHIGTLAFTDCSSLESILVPTQVKTIYGGAFMNCVNVKVIDFMATNCTDFAAQNGVFLDVGKNQTELNVVIGDSVQVIPDYLFCPQSSATSYITSLDLGNGVETIGKYAFSGCANITGELFIPNSVISIDTYCFSNLQKIETLTISENVKSIAPFAFEGLTRLLTINYNAKEAVCYQGGDAYTFTNIATTGYAAVYGVLLNIGDSVEKMPGWLFCGPNGLNIKELNMGKNVISIGESAFRSCKLQGSVTIPASVTYIGANAFLGCSNLSAMTFEVTTGWWSATSATATSGSAATPSLQMLISTGTAARHWFRS
ncbi:MAG: leucine-rich repeat domain-containing protein [Clostridia bacterium]|nr:leucine-rich repeat domain-containing protein [Clostridia bacterium]